MFKTKNIYKPERLQDLLGKKDNNIGRGKHAEALLKDELLQEAFNCLKDMYISTWMQSDEIKQREALHTAVVVVDRVQDNLRAILEDGFLEQKELEELEKNK